MQARVQRIKASEAQIQAFLSNLRRIIATRASRISADIQAGKIQAKDAAKMLGSMMDELKKAGLYKEIASIQNVYADELRYINREYKALLKKDISYTDADRVMAKTLVSYEADYIANSVSSYASEIKSALMRSVLIGEKTNFNDLEEKYGSRFVNNLETELNTNLAAFSRTVTITKGKELGIERYRYVGPDDNATREFCEETLNPKDRQEPVYSLAEINRMDNGQGTPVITFCGGYNCRHQWIAEISDEELEAEADEIAQMEAQQE